MELAGKTILITGIGGFIGLRAAELALQQGMKVRGLQRTAAKAEPARVLGAEVMLGDINDPMAARQACQGVDIVLHLAGLIRETGDINEFTNVIVNGTLNMAKTAKDCGVTCFVNVSSALIYGFSYPNHVTEAGPFYKGNNPFCKTKLAADQQVMQLNQPPQFGVINIRPGDVYGPRSLVWVVRPLQFMKKGMFVLINDGRGVINHIYVDNLIDGIFLAIERQAYGEAFNLTDGCETSWKEYFLRLAEIGQMPKPAAMPEFAVRTFAKLHISDNSVSAASIDSVTRPYAYSIEKARSQLGYQPRIDLDNGMKRTADWLTQEDIYTPEWVAQAKASK